MVEAPAGTVTLLFTDIEGSTRLLRQLGERYADALAEQRRLLRAAFATYGGYEVDTQGDAFFVAFARAPDAVSAAVDGQRALAAHQWPEDLRLRVRMGLHTGAPLRTDEGYAGIDVHRGARVATGGHGEQVLLTEATAALVRGALPEGVTLADLGDHRFKDLPDAEHVFQLLIEGLQRDFPPLRSLGAGVNNLPVPATSFVGREREVTEIQDLLSNSRVVTLSGPGGTGKTRLALAAAADVVETYRDGGWLVELASLADANLIADAVAQAVGVREEPGRPMRAVLVDALKDRRLLLILDNCEHLVSGAATLIAAVVAACPDVRVLATSQEVLRIPGEVVYRVGALAVPDEHDVIGHEAVQIYRAVRLFAERAAAVAPGFALTAQNVAAVVEICRRLDGIPLAIELAAARARLLAPAQIAQRLNDRFRLLAGGSRTAMPRQQTLRSAIDWSYALLDERERAVLRRLSVFAGGWSIEAAEVVGADEQPVLGIDQYEVLDLIGGLADKSLITVRSAGAELRYAMLQSIRQYAAERLVESDEARSVRARHRDWYLEFAERSAAETEGPDQAVWFERLEQEHDNLRAAMDWSLGDGREAGLRISAALWRFWDVRGHAAEGWRRLERALASATEAPAALRANGLTAAGGLARRAGELGRAVQLDREAVASYRVTSDSDGLSVALSWLVLVERDLGNHDHAAALSEECLQIARGSGDFHALAIALGNSGLVARDQSDYELAVARFSEALSLFRVLDDRVRLVWMLNALAGVMVEIRKYERALSYCEEARRIEEELHDQHRLAWLSRIEGMVARRQGYLPLALTKLRESLELFQAENDQRSVAYCLLELAATAIACGRPVEAVRLLACETTLRETTGFSLTPVLSTHREEYMPEARALLGADAFALAWSEGRSMRIEDALAPILAEIPAC